MSDQFNAERDIKLFKDLAAGPNPTDVYSPVIQPEHLPTLTEQV